MPTMPRFLPCVPLLLSLALSITLGACSDGTTVTPGPDAKIDTGPAPTCANDADCKGEVTGCQANRCLEGQCKVVGIVGTCDDGNACTKDDQCLGGACGSLAKAPCEDNNPCTTDACDPKVGCSHTPEDKQACDDGNPCTVADACLQDKCKAGAERVCDDKNVCTDDSCDKTVGCVFSPASGSCDDGNACTQGDACLGGECQPGSDVSCDDGNPCTQDSCAKATGCVHTAQEGPCTDGSLCTEGDACQGGVCMPGTATVCDDGKACTMDDCDPKVGCVAMAMAGTCTDGDACTVGDTCVGDTCAPGTAALCDDASPCTLDSCDTTVGCVHLASVGTCTDGDACTTGDACVGKACKPGTAIVCDDGNGCTNDSCDAIKGCVHAASTAACSDGNACTNGDLCAAGVCLAGSATTCDDGNTCTTDSCDATAGVTCIDGSDVTAGDQCGGGVCLGVDVTCTTYCAAATTHCTGLNSLYTSQAACLTTCAKAKWPVGKGSDVSGDSLACRVNYAVHAAKNANDCTGASQFGGGVCGTLCENYCQLALANCPALFSGAAACSQACAGASGSGSVGVKGANVPCYIGFALDAATDATQCTSAAIPNGPGGQCVAP
jgi:hypothetical protein